MLRTNWVYRVFCVMVVSVSLFSVAMADTRKYMLGDIDGLHYDGAGSVDHVYVDPCWWAKFSEDIHPPIAFDVQDDNCAVPGTFLFPLAPGERVVAAHFTIAIKGVHPLVSTDYFRLKTSHELEVGGHYTEWGWGPVPQTTIVTRTVDLSDALGNNLIPHMQDGVLNFRLGDDTAVDYAILTIEVIPAPSKVQDNFKSPEARAAQFRYKSLIIPIERAYAAKLKKIQSGRAVKLKAARSKFVKKLDEALKKEIQAGNLDEAIKIRDAKRRIKKTSDNSVVSIIQNNWNFKSFEARTARFQYESLVILVEKTYASKVKKIQEERDVKLQTIKDKLVKKLDEALKKEVQSGNLDEAIKIRNAKRAFEKAPLRPKPPKKTSPPPKKTVPKEVDVIRQRTEEYPKNKTDYATISNDLVFDVGMGNENYGYGFAGIEIAGVRKLRVTLKNSPRFSHHDVNSFAGFIIDYHTNNGYEKRVLLGIGLLDKERWEKAPNYGANNSGDQFVDIGMRNFYEIDLNKWAPAGWDGKTWFTVGIENAGKNNKIKAKIDTAIPIVGRQHKKDKSFTIKALIDGDTKLVITPKGIFWRNGRVKKLGKSRGNNDPTLINGKPWLPVWGKPHTTKGRDETKPFPLRIGRISNVSVKTIAIATEKNKSGIRRRTPITVYQSGENWIVSIPDREPGCMWYTLRITIK